MSTCSDETRTTNDDRGNGTRGTSCNRAESRLRSRSVALSSFAMPAVIELLQQVA
jgi:hypothetical protein